MKLRTKRLFATLLTGVLATSMLFNDAVPAKADNLVKDAETYQYNSSDPLFAATHFHFFAKEYAEIRTHCHGNVATTKFSAGSNSGSNKLGDAVKSEIFYFREIDDSNGFIANFAGATVVLGNEIDVTTMNNAEVYLKTSGGSQIKVEPNSAIYRETSTATADRFIDFDEEFKKLVALSEGLASEPSINRDLSSTGNSTGVEVSWDTSNYTIDMTNQTAQTSYVHIKSSDVSSVNDFKIEYIDGFKSGEALVINFELPAGTTEYTLPFTKVLTNDSTSQLNSREDWGDYIGHGNILWNFYTVDTATNKPVAYDGIINTCNEFKGTILAPNAEIHLANSNQDGNFIGTKVYGGGGETHRWDFGGSLPRYNNGTTDITDPKPTGSLEVIIKEAGTGTPIKGATVTVTGTLDNGGSYEETFTTDQNGKLIVDASTDKTVIDSLGYGNYIATVTDVPDGYNTPAPSSPVTINSAATIQIPFEVSKSTPDPDTPTVVQTGSLNVFVVDSQTFAHISGVKIALYAPDGTTKICDMTTDTSGYTTTTATGLTITDDTTEVHIIKIIDVPDGYEIPANATQQIYSSTLHTVPIYLHKEKTGSIQATIIDEKFDDSIPGTQIQIIDENGKVVQTLTTNSDGKTDIASNLPLNKTYTIKVISIPDGATPGADTDADPDNDTHKHPVPASKTVTLTPENPDVVVPFVTSPSPNGKLQITLEDTTTTPYTPVEGATFDVITTVNGQEIVIATLTTDENGETDEVLNLVLNKEYKIKVINVPDGYTKPSDDTIEITLSTDQGVNLKELYVQQSGSFQPTIVDSKSGALIDGAEITVTGTKTDGTSFTVTDTTDSTGKIPVISDIKVGTEVTVVVNSVPAGYNKPDTTTVKITDNKLKEETLKVAKKTGSLQATIIDENTKEEIKDAYVTITNQKGEIVFEGKTDENGQTPVIKDLPILEDYKIHTNSVPHGYTPPADYTARVENETPMTSVTLEVKTSTEETNKGSLQATIIDKNTKDPIKDATVEIKDSTGKVIATEKTDENGKTPIISGLTINNTYTIHTSTVPDGYTAPGDQDITIKDGELTTVDLTVAKTTPDTGSLQAVITDKNTKAPIANATVEIKDGAGNIIATVKTDKDGLTPIVSNLTIGTTYTIHVVEVPSGYTAPDDKSQLIASAALFKVELVVAKSADTTVQTGDSTNPFGVGMVGILSLIAFIVLVSKKREA